MEQVIIPGGDLIPTFLPTRSSQSLGSLSLNVFSLGDATCTLGHTVYLQQFHVDREGLTSRSLGPKGHGDVNSMQCDSKGPDTRT